MKKTLLSLFAAFALCVSASADVKECELSALPASSENTTWDATTNTFAWSATSYNSTEVFGGGDYSYYDTFNYETEAGSADHFRIIVKFTNGASQVTYNPAQVGNVSLTWAQMGVDAENLKFISTIRISGANDCIGDVKLSKIYLEGTGKEKPTYTVPEGSTNVKDLTGTNANWASSVVYPMTFAVQGKSFGDGDGSSMSTYVDVSEYDKMTFVVTNSSDGLSLRTWMWDEVNGQVVTLFAYPEAMENEANYTEAYKITEPGNYVVKFNGLKNLKGVKAANDWGASALEVGIAYVTPATTPTPYTVNAKVTADGNTKTFEGQTLEVLNGADGELTVTLPAAKAAGYSMESQSVKVKLDGENLSMVEGQTVNFSFAGNPIVVTVTDVTGTITDDIIDVTVKGQGDNGKSVVVEYTTPMPADAKIIEWTDGSKHIVKSAVTMKVDVDGETDRTFSFGSYEDMTFYAVDFGDGNLVLTDTIKATTGSATKTAAHGVALGEGNITIYASSPSDVWYFSTSTGGVKASQITSIDLTKLTNVHQMSIGGTNLETMDLSACDSLRNFTAAMGSFTSMDFSNNPELTSINMVNNKLASINVSKNAKLDQLTVYQNELTELDLTANAALTGLVAYENKLTSVKFAEGAELKTINLQKNQLASIELPTIVGSTSMLYLNDNQLTELTVPSSVATFEAQNNKLTKISLVDCTKSCKLENNCFTIATLPAKPAGLNTASKIKKFTYAPQAPLAVEESVDGSIDLSAQLTAMGELTEEATTEYTVVDAEGNELTADDDYKVENGVISFKEKFNNIRVVMTSAAFPKATGANAFTTTTFSVSNPATSINALSLGAKSSEAMFNLNGVKMAAPAKGIIIKSGKKFYVK